MEILADLLGAETAHRQAASIRYRLTAAKLPVMKDLAAFNFEGSPINEGLVRSLYDGAFLANHRNVVLVGGTGTGKTHLAIAITANVVRAGARGRYFNTVDLVNQLEDEARRGKAGALATQLSRLDLVVLDELGYLPLAQAGGQRLFHLVSKLYDHHHQPHLWRVALRLRRRQDDHGAPRPAHPPLRHRRDWQRQLAAQKPKLIPAGARQSYPQSVQPPPRPPSGQLRPQWLTRRPGAALRMAPRLAATQRHKRGGLFWAPIGGPDCAPFDTRRLRR
jgi:hypothetical protein